MAIAPVNKFVSLAVPVAPGLQKLYEVPTGTSALLLYAQVANVGIAVTYPKVTFVQKRTSRSTGNTRDVRVVKDAEIPPNDAVILIDGRLVLEKTPLVLDQIYVQGTQDGVGIITGVNYDEPTGIATVFTKEAHNFSVTDPVTMAGIAFTCLGTTGITTTVFPDPQQSYTVDTVSNTKEFSTVVGGSKGYPHVYNSAIHYFERARDNAVEVAVGTGGYTSFTAISGTTYSPTTGNLVIKTASAHGLSVGDLIRINDGGITFTCATDSNASNHPYPRATDPASGKILTITAVTSDTFTVDVGTSSDTSTHTFVSGVANAIKKINTRFNVTNAVYNGGPQTTTIHGITNLAPGDIVLTLNANHNLTGGNKIRIAIDSIIFTCTMDNRATEHAYPRKTDPAVPTPRPSDAKNLGGDIAVQAYTSNQLKLNVYPSLSGGFFAPLQMELIASILENSTS